MLRETFLVFAALVVVLASATQVNHCNNGRAYDSEEDVEISDCSTPPCKLRKRNSYSVVQKFVAERDVSSVSTSVNAEILKVPLPFIGVDGMDACKDIYNTDGTKAGCPLKKGVTYIYKNQFPILEFYPKVSLKIHYALVDGSDQIACFEVPAKITD